VLLALSLLQAMSRLMLGYHCLQALIVYLALAPFHPNNINPSYNTSHTFRPTLVIVNHIVGVALLSAGAFLSKQHEHPPHTLQHIPVIVIHVKVNIATLATHFISFSAQWCCS
jgi:hypothetical protein